MCGDDGVSSWFMYQKLLELVEFKLKEVISREHSLLIFMIGVPNIAKSVLINSIHQIALSCFPGKLLLCYTRLCLNVIVFRWNYGEVY